jgi:hypothetical protein
MIEELFEWAISTALKQSVSRSGGPAPAGVPGKFWKIISVVVKQNAAKSDYVPGSTALHVDLWSRVRSSR